MRITIHQPEHLPWLGFFHKVNMADKYVVLDNVQYRRRYFQNRNKIRTKNGWRWVIVPLEKESRDGLLIKEAKISHANPDWREENLKTIYHSYCKSEYFKRYWDGFKAVYGQDYIFLIDLNINLIGYILENLGLKQEVVFASQLNVSSKKGDLIFDICNSLNATAYVSGISGKDYLDFQKFHDRGIKLIVQDFHHPLYRQLYEPFIPCMSIIDLLFNYGDKSLDVILGKGVEVLKEVFL